MGRSSSKASYGALTTLLHSRVKYASLASAAFAMRLSAQAMTFKPRRKHFKAGRRSGWGRRQISLIKAVMDLSFDAVLRAQACSSLGASHGRVECPGL
jgi:hypothetical protein